MWRLAWADSWVLGEECRKSPPFHIRAHAMYHGTPCAKCVKKAKSLGMATGGAA